MSHPTLLIVGGGGREHALAWKLTGDSSKPTLFIAPGNAGTDALGTNLDLAADDVAGLTEWAVAHRPDLVIIGPEAPLCAGLTDRLEAEGLKVFGPSQAAAQLEGSKVFSKEIMEAAGVPTAEAASFTGVDEALAYLNEKGAPIVIKADGLAAGKGVSVCTAVAEAEQAIRDALEGNVFGEAGSRVLIEEFLDGEEASILALVDGEHCVLLASSQDHKRIGDADTGPNTGGMGAYSPAPVVTDALWPMIRDDVVNPTIAELARRGIPYRGVLYAGLMITSRGLKVLEFNCRFGDPECQAILLRWDGDLLPALLACADGTLDESMVTWKPESSVCVVLAAHGYPGKVRTGDVILGLDDAASQPNAVVFHAGTTRRDGAVVTAGGRVLGVTALGADLNQAVDHAYRAVNAIGFDGVQYRRDIGWRARRRET